MFETDPPPCNLRFLESRLAYRIQELTYGGLKPETIRRLEALVEQLDGGNTAVRKTRADERPIAGTRLVRELQGVEHTVTVLKDGFERPETAYQKQEGWILLEDRDDDGGFSGGTLDRPALKRLLTDIEEGQVEVVVVYKIERLSRALMDFARLVEVFDRNEVTLVSVTQPFNTTTSMGRPTLNALLSFAQFEREVAGERIRDKHAASRARGMWMGDCVPWGYRRP